MMYPTKFHKLSTFFDVFCRFSHNPMGQRGSLFVVQPLIFVFLPGGHQTAGNLPKELRSAVPIGAGQGAKILG